MEVSRAPEMYQRDLEDCRMKYLIAMLCGLLLVTACASGPSKSELDDEVRRLCAIDGGIKVYETVKLPKEKFDQWGNIRIPAKSKATTSDEYYYEREQINLVSGDPQMDKTIHKIIRHADGKILGISIWYSRGGGDLPGPWHPSSLICPEISKDAPSLESSIFIKGATK